MLALKIWILEWFRRYRIKCIWNFEFISVTLTKILSYWDKVIFYKYQSFFLFQSYTFWPDNIFFVNNIEKINLHNSQTRVLSIKPIRGEFRKFFKHHTFTERHKLRCMARNSNRTAHPVFVVKKPTVLCMEGEREWLIDHIHTHGRAGLSINCL